MKNRGWLWLIAAVFVVCLGLSAWLLVPRQAAHSAQIWSKGQLLETVDLSVDREITVETDLGKNVVTVRNGKIAVTEASCPDHYCMHRGFAGSGLPIVCLPNRLEIRFVAGGEVDGAVG